MKRRSVGQIAVGQARFKAYNFEKITVFWVFCCVDFVTSTKTNLEAKIDLSALFWRDSFSGPKRKRGIMHTVYTHTFSRWQLYRELNTSGVQSNIYLSI